MRAIACTTALKTFSGSRRRVVPLSTMALSALYWRGEREREEKKKQKEVVGCSSCNADPHCLLTRTKLLLFGSCFPSTACRTCQQLSPADSFNPSEIWEQKRKARYHQPRHKSGFIWTGSGNYCVTTAGPNGPNAVEKVKSGPSQKGHFNIQWRGLSTLVQLPSPKSRSLLAWVQL